ncbi:PAS domain S-box protein [Cyanobium sp. ATX 6F1]|uniref:HAMP domain-containing protein n=1 Tax=unclassified Cyanobium TaxID=2627006 RepID=UPI0020CC090E|nr:PAS domain S-box protein [Cyanobium sp. ATX 6F1]MCP9917033.1 PAS domain S-box protein [Cyanobium sp. ATX 6F1]
MTTQNHLEPKSSWYKALSFQAFRLNLRTYLVVPFVLQTVATVGLVGFLSFRHSQRAVNELAAQLQDSISKQVLVRVTNFLNTPHRVNALNANAASLGLIRFDNIDAARPFLWKQVNAFNDIGYSGLVDREGRFIRIGWANNRFASDEDPQLALQLKPGSGDLVYYGLDRSGNPADVEKVRSNFDAKDSPLFKAAVAARRPTWGPVTVNFGYDNLQLNAVSPYFGPGGKLLGIFNTQISLDQISQFLRSLKVSRNSKVYIFERTGELIASSSPNQPLIVGKGDQRQRLLASESTDPMLRGAMGVINENLGSYSRVYESHQYEFKLDGDRELMRVSPLEDGKGLQWLLMVVTPEADFMGQIEANSKTTIFLCVGSLVFAVFLGLASSQWVTNPIEKISQAARRLAAGDLNQTVDPSVIIEIDQLAGSFNNMTHQLQASFTALEQSNLELTLAEENFRSIFENAQDGIFQSSVEGRLLRANPALADIYGYHSTKEMLASVKDVNTQFFQNPEVVTELQERLKRDGTLTDFVYSTLREDGDSIWLELDARLVKDAAGKTLYLEGIARDVTDRKLREESLERQLRELKVEIDQGKKQQDVEKLTSSTFFREAKQQIEDLDLENFWS